MRRITTRELLHHNKRVQAALEKGESFTWVSRGRVLGYIQPVRASGPGRAAHDWLERARAAGAVSPAGASVAEQLYQDRG